ncbi:hypothetical protein K439DRAFT_1631298 [Ramaria rubella]|nr:hypothetical protein K439DRAFT_1631298 [Ramaria rubella]
MQLIPTTTDSTHALLNSSSADPTLHADIVDGQASDSTVTTGSVILERLDDSNFLDISTSEDRRERRRAIRIGHDNFYTLYCLTVVL